MGCTWTTPSKESIVNLLLYFSRVNLKRYKGQDTMNDTDHGADAVMHDDIVTDCPLRVKIP